MTQRKTEKTSSISLQRQCTTIQDAWHLYS